MAVKIKFDDSYSVIPPTLVLATRSGKKLGAIPASNIVLADHFNANFDLSFDIYQYYNDEELNLWDSITNFKLIWCADWDLWFEIYVEQTDSAIPVKNVTCVSLAEAELSQVNLYDIEINTEDDIARDDYEVTVLYNPDNPEGSLLHRITEKIPHYTITHVDERIASIQRTFTFDDISIYDAFQEIAEEIDCIFILDSGTNEDGSIARSIAVYDLEAYCPDCDTRGEFSDVCSECGGTNILPGYGTDTSIYVSVDNLAEDVTFTTDTDSVKNCFRLEGGDDLITATIRNCNPNGTQYIWYFSDELKADMSDELVAKIAEYDELYSYYQNEHEISLNSDMLSAYNTLVQKYAEYGEDLEEIPDPIVGYPALMQAYYDTIDFYYFLHDEFMPDASLADTSAEEQAALLTAENLSPVAVQNIDSCSSATASSAVLAMAKVVCDSRYQIKVKTSSYDSESCYWTGNFTVTNYSDEDDTATSETIELTITGNYEQYVRQKLEKSLNSSADDDDSIATDISGLFGSGLESFKVQIKYYCLTSLTSFYDACQSCLDILVEQGVADFQTWADQDPDLYTELYLDYYNKLGALEDEIALREEEIAIIQGVYDSDGELTDAGLQTYILQARNEIQETLDFEEYLGDDLLLEFAAYRREDLYQNENYISDGLTNAELFANAMEFLETAQKEIYKSATQQHSITATLRNLLVMEEFKPIVDNFSVGNWIRVRVDDSVYRLRLVTYEIDFDDLTNFSIEFSDVTEVATGVTDSQSIFAQAASMASSYSEVSSNASKGASSSTYIDYWFETGLDTTNIKLIQGADNQEQTWDSHGMLFRKYDEVENDYSLTQLKIINSTMAITDDGWQTVKTAVGNFYYQDPADGTLKSAYGINGEVLVGKLILGEGLGIYNSANTFKVNEDGMTITNGVNTFLVDPNGDNLLVLSNTEQDLLWVDSDGGLHLRGDGSELDISMNSSITNLSGAMSDASASILAIANSYADGAVAALEESVSATYETKDDADTTEEILSEAISSAQETAEAYADRAISAYDITVQATYETKSDADTTEETLSKAISSAQEDAESYADKAVAKYDTMVIATYETIEDAEAIKARISHYGTCDTEADESVKVIDCSTFTSDSYNYDGVILSVVFTNGNTTIDTMLSIGGLTVTVNSMESTANWDAGDTVLFVFNGNYWNVITYSSIYSSAVATSSSYAESCADQAYADMEKYLATNYSTTTATSEAISDAISTACSDEDGAIATYTQSLLADYVTQDALTSAKYATESYADSAADKAVAEYKDTVESYFNSYILSGCDYYGTTSSTGSAWSVEFDGLTSSDDLYDGTTFIITFEYGGSIGSFTKYINIDFPADEDTGISSSMLVVTKTTDGTTITWSDGDSVAFEYSNSSLIPISVSSDAISAATTTIIEKSESYADSAIATYNTTVEATYETQNNATTARASILSEAKTYVDGEIATIQAEVTTLSYQITHYGTCSTEASTNTKVVECESFLEESLVEGTVVTVYFTYKNSSNVTYLNVNGTGAKLIYANGTYLTSSSEYNWPAKSTVQFMYTGSYWRLVDSGAYASLALTIKDGVGVLSANASYIELSTGELVINAGNLTLDSSGNATFAGTLSAPSGTIGGFTIGTSAIYKTKSSLSSTSSGVYVGTDGIACGSSAFKVTSSGALTATSATITGTITTTSGSRTAKLSSGGLHFLYSDTDYGSFATTNWSSTSLYGINMNLENSGYFLAFARDDDGDSSYIASYYISYSTSISSYRHNFAGTEHHGGAITTSSNITLSSGHIYLANAYAIYMKNSSGTNYSTLLVSSGNYTHVGNSSLTAVQLNANSSSVAFNGSALYSSGTTLGTSGTLWGQIYSSSSSISTSDRNIKHDINEITDLYMSFYYALTPVSYMKNGGDRIHIGAISQDVLAALESVGLTADDFGGFCRDEKIAYSEYDEEGSPIESSKYVVTDDDGNIQYNYALRYEEFIFLAIEATHRHQKTLDDHETRIKELEERVAELEAQLAA